MNTVSNLRAVAREDAVDLPGLPDEVRVALAGVATAAREGLLAMSVWPRVVRGVPRRRPARRVVMERMLAGLATRRHSAANESVGADVEAEATAWSSSCSAMQINTHIL